MKAQRLTKEMEQDVIVWINRLLKENNSTSEKLINIIKDGKKLCRIANELVAKPSKNLPHKMTMPFACMENIEFFIKAVREIGVPDYENFLTVDLWGEKDLYQVVLTLNSVARNRRAIYPKFPLVGQKDFDESLTLEQILKKEQ